MKEEAVKEESLEQSVSTTRTILVSLDTDPGANPNVILEDADGKSGRNEEANSGDTIQWQRKGGAGNFEIVNLDPTGAGTAFGDYEIGGSGQWLRSLYQPPNTSPGTGFEYTLRVLSGGQIYDTTESSPEADDDRPVIRNF